MKVRAALWYAYPGAHAETRDYRSIGDVLDDFESMLDSSRRFGGPHPVGFIYAMDSDYPIWMLETSARETIKKSRC